MMVTKLNTISQSFFQSSSSITKARDLKFSMSTLINTVFFVGYVLVKNLINC